MNLLFWRKKKKTNLFFPRAAALREEGFCVTCEKDANISDIRDVRSYENLKILGMCQDCQDNFFRIGKEGCRVNN